MKVQHPIAFWQDARLNDEARQEYVAVSLSKSGLDQVRDYIKNKEEHHKKKTFQQEYDEIITKYEFKKLMDN